MQKIFLLSSVIFLYSSTCAFTSTPPSISAQDTDSVVNIDLNSPELEANIKEGEINLKKISAQQVQQEQKQRLVHTQQAYQDAVVLYRQQRPGPAKDALGDVEDLMEGYKSTDVFLKNIDEQAAERSRRRMQRIRLMADPQLINNLAQEAADMYQQAAVLGGDKYTASVKKKLIRLRQAMEKLKRERSTVSPKAAKQLYIQQQLDQMGQKAEDFDLKIFKLTKALNYSEARKKYIEFQGAMIDDLERLKQIIESRE